MDINAGNMYDYNKELVKNYEKPLTHVELAARQEALEGFFEDKVVKYAMLLCHEQRDYTLFNLKATSTAIHQAAKEVILCCMNRGEVVGIDKTDDGLAYEIWIIIDDEAYCYYLFPYDQAVIECE
jgi:hypothetical protein